MVSGPSSAKASRTSSRASARTSSAFRKRRCSRARPNFSPPGYHQYWYSAEKKGYSGTAVFTRMEPLSVRYGIGKEEHSHEGRAITLEFEQFFLVNVYTPNSQNELARLPHRMQWEDDLRAYLCALDTENLWSIAAT